MSCPASYAAPDPHRPQITFSVDVGDDHRTVLGHEKVVFTPDRPVTEMVFRLWPNAMNHRPGGSLLVTGANVDGRAAVLHAETAGGVVDTQGTLLRIPIGHQVAAGESVTADLDFTLKLPPPFIDRLGSDGTTAWFGSAMPQLAWESGTGWVTRPAAVSYAEQTVSEAARVDLTVLAPAADTVVANGVGDAPVAVSGGQRRWHFTAASARDTLVAVGRLRVVTASVPTPDGPVPVLTASPDGLDFSPDEVMQQVRRALPLLVAHLGPYPFDSLTIVGVPGLYSTGIEYPGAFLLGDSIDQSTTTHELAHSWFYALVGNDQGLHPWLDEAFATVMEQIVDAELFDAPVLTSPDSARLLADPRPVDSPVTAFVPNQAGYEDIIYTKGAAALLEARVQAGAAPFDAALRCYINAEAWKNAVPADVAAALAKLPAALAVLRKAGAIP